MSKRKNKPILPKVGDTVVLNDEGLEQIWGCKLGLAHMKTLEMKVTYVDPENLCDDIPTHTIHVDNEEINQFSIDNNCVDIVEDK